MVQTNAMNNVTISPARLEDVDTLWRWGEENKELWGGEESKWYNKEELVSLIGKNRDDLLFIARYGKAPVGMCLTRVFEGWAYLEALLVQKKYRGQKIGTMMVKETVDSLKNRHIRYLSIQPEVENKKAHALYSKLGFVQGFTFHWMDKKL